MPYADRENCVRPAVCRTTQRPAEQLGYRRLVGYAFTGDFEGQVTYGLAIRAGGPDRTPIRVGELRRADGTYVVAVDVRQR